MENMPENETVLPEIGLPIYPSVGGSGGDTGENIISDPAENMPVDNPPLPDPMPVEEIIVDPVGEIIEFPGEELVSENKPVPVEDDGEEKSGEEKEPYNIVVESPEYQLSSNVTVSVNTEEIPIDELIAAVSRNRVSMNLSNNFSSVSSVQILSMDAVPWFDKPFSEYTATEGILLTMMLCMVLGYVFNRLARGFNLNDL
ncbi:MAG: hypothetical protein K6F35_07985 [Lachnospiraceae bacterium]|nr:hypothetical protein [Lachnospiraceae bacterium]